MKPNVTPRVISNNLAVFTLLVIGGILTVCVVVPTTAQNNAESQSETSVAEHAKATDVPLHQAVSTNAIISERTPTHLGPSVRSRLLEARFQEDNNGVFQRQNVTLGEVMKLLHFRKEDMKRTMSSSPLEPSYLVQFEDARCLVSFLGGVGRGPTDSNVVDVIVNTNAPSTGKKLMPKVSPVVKEKSSATNETE